MKNLIAFIFLLTSSASFAWSDVGWFDGSVVLRDNRVLIGKINVQPAYDLVLVDFKDSIAVLPAHKIANVRYFDTFTNMNRKFTVIQLKTESTRVFRLFEIVVSGEIQILRRLRSDAFNESDHATGYSYYTLYNNSLEKIDAFAKAVHPGVNSASLKEFVRKNKLSLYIAEDVIVIIQFLNRNLLAKKPDISQAKPELSAFSFCGNKPSIQRSARLPTPIKYRQTV